MRLSLSFLFVICGLFGYAQVIENPVFDRTDQPLFHVDKVELTQDSTIIYCTYDAEIGSWANISSQTYLEDCSTGDKYRIEKCEGLPYAPEQKIFYNGGRIKIRLFFPKCQFAGKINLVEIPNKDAFNIYGISLKEGNEGTYADYSLKRVEGLTTTADFFSTAKNYEKAIEYEKQSMHITKYWIGRYNEMYDHSVYMLGHYYCMLENYNKAKEYIIEDVEIRKELYGTGSEQYTMSLVNLANCYINQQKIVDAIQLYEQAVSTMDSISNNNNMSYAIAKSLLAQAYYTIGDIPKATKYTEKGININKSLIAEEDKEYIIHLMDLAQYSMWTDLSKAEDVYQKLTSVIRQYYGEENSIYLTAINGLAQCYILRNKPEEALILDEEHEKLTSKLYGENSTEMGYSLNLKSQIYAYLHNYDKAIEYGLASIKALKPTLSPDAYSNSLSIIADYFAQNNDYGNALKYSSEAIDIFRNEVLQDYKNASPLLKYTWWQKRHYIYDSGYPLYVYKNMNNIAVQELYNNTLLFKGITLEEHFNQECNWKEIQHSLKGNEIAIEFIQSYEQSPFFCYYAVIIKRDYEVPKLFRLFDLSKFGELLKQAEDEVISFQTLQRELSLLIWGTINEELNGVENIYFSPAGIFHCIAIEHLPFDENFYYSDKYNLYRLSSTKQLLAKKERPNYKKAVLYGGLDYDYDVIETAHNIGTYRSGYDFLPNSKEEVELISDILKAKRIKPSVFCGSEGTEKTFRNLSSQDFEILHLATHGENIQIEDVEKNKNKNNLGFLRTTNNFVYEDDALSWSFLLLSGGNGLISRTNNSDSDSDGILTALEISAMDFSNLELVVLSACKTALGHSGVDNSILGLQRGFKRAGANTIIMSLREVDDEVAKLLMEEFYKNLMDGKTKYQSLKAAQKCLREGYNGKYNLPSIWGSFIMLDGLN